MQAFLPRQRSIIAQLARHQFFYSLPGDAGEITPVNL
jgi:hypothetical protein